jgi:demethylmenaquinone methyltransferase/2-methoxy-6-polyprenyl-1,4-benzoquinol methylase
MKLLMTTWDDKLLENPHEVADKRTRVQKMFAAIAPSYDINNRLHSLWMDQRWRRKAVALAKLDQNDYVVDVACGTGDLALMFAKAIDTLRFQLSDIPPDAGQVVGVDFTFEMLRGANSKPQVLTMRDKDGFLHVSDEERARLPVVCSPWGDRIDNSGRHSTVTKWINGDAQSLPLDDQSADVVSIAFGIRNVQDVPTALREFHRILRPGGRVIVLEFSLPTNLILRGLYNFYFRKILPRTATLISGDKTGAYKYLPESVNTFIGRDQMIQMMRDAGFVDVEQFPLTFGVCVCYRGMKR